MNKVFRENVLLFISICITITITILIPGFMISSDPKEFFFIQPGIMFEIILLIFIFQTIIFIPFLFWMRENIRLNRFLYFIYTWILVSGLLFPLVQNAGMKDIQELNINLRNFIFVISVSSFLTFLTFTKYKNWVVIFSFIFSISSFLTAIPAFMNLPFRIDTSKQEKFYKLSNKKNIVVLSFDGIPGFIFKKALQKNPIFQDIFKDFIFYENIVSQSPSTLGSLRSELFGNQDYHAYGDRNDEVNSKLNLKNAIINQYDDAFTYSEYNLFKENPNQKIIPGELIQSKNIENHILLYKYIFARVFTPFSFSLFKKFDLFNLLYKIHSDRVIEMERSHIGIKWKTQYLKQKVEYENIVQNISTGESPISIRYYHFVFTHFPVDFDESCNFRGNNGDWYLTNQNEDGLINESTCFIKLFKNFIDKLKSLGIYEKTYLVIKSDHGEPVYYFTSYPENIKINNNNLGYNRYRPLLLIKKIKSNQSSMLIDNRLSSLSNLSKTICEDAELDSNLCKNNPGYSLTFQGSKQAEHLYLEVVKNERSDFMFEDHETLKFQVDTNDFLSLLKTQSKLDLQEYNPLYFPYLSKRLDDLSILKNLLESYHLKNGSYPVSKAWDGFKTIYGYSGDDYIHGLVPEFIDKLPIDPSPNENEQYLYKSDGKDFKLIFHSNMDECSRRILKEKPELVDPSRNCWAYGYWTPDARRW